MAIAGLLYNSLQLSIRNKRKNNLKRIRQRNGFKHAIVLIISARNNSYEVAENTKVIYIGCQSLERTTVKIHYS